MSRWRLRVSILAVLGTLTIVVAGSQHASADDLRFDIRTYRDAIAPIYAPSLTTPDNIELNPDTMVLGVEINGDARAYPIEPLIQREIVNDTVGGVPVAVTWCPLCFTGLVYDRRLDGRALTLGVQGALYNGAQTWWDHETRSIWSQVFGRALVGPLQGRTLKLLPAALVPWGSWVLEHPASLVLKTRPPFRAPNTGFDNQARPNDVWVIGIQRGADAAGFYFDDTARLGIQTAVIGGTPVVVYAEADSRLVRTYAASTDDRTLSFVYADGILRDAETGSTWDPLTGQATAGPLLGSNLEPTPYFSIWDWALRQHYGSDTPIFPLPAAAVAS